MTQVRAYNSPEAFKQALEARLRQVGNMNRARQILVMERFYARIAAVMGEAVVVKGGMVLERRLDRARTTKDLDLRLSGAPAALLHSLQEAGRIPLGDFLTFTVEPDPTHATIEGDGMVSDIQSLSASASWFATTHAAPASRLEGRRSNFLCLSPCT